MIGGGGAGAGSTRASSRSKNSPWKVVGAPVSSCAEHGEALLHASPARRGVDAADLDLVAVLAADAHAEDQATGRELAEVGQLAGDEDGMA